jgi:hypothetical protein
MARKSWVALVLVMLLGVTACPASGEDAGTVTLRQDGRARLTSAEEDTLRNLAMEFLKSSNFNTVAHRDILKQSVPAIQARYRQVVAGACLIVTYDHPVTVRTVGGNVSVFEIVIGLGRLDYADALFTIDEQGRVVGHGKYSGSVGIKLRRAADGPSPR